VPREEVSAFRVTVPAADEDLATALLWEAGTLGVQVDLRGPDAVLLAYFAAGAQTASAVSAALESLPVSRVEEAAVPYVDWVARFRDGFRAFDAGAFRIVPAWAPELPAAGRHRLVVDPGQAFGTGTHESTRLSLAALERLCAVRRPRRVLDVGTGSGILAVASRLLGARVAVGIEIDPDALPAARDHAMLNDVDVHFVRGDGARAVRPGSCDVVLANIVAPLLVARAEEICAAARPGGDVVLAGILGAEARTVVEAFAPFMAEGPADVRTEGEWASVAFRRRA
jgi:ribosomal protein L11 methyltransferase